MCSDKILNYDCGILSHYECESKSYKRIKKVDIMHNLQSLSNLTEAIEL